MTELFTDLLIWAKSIPLDFATVISLIALFLSGLTHVFNRRSWYETYRPIVTAKIETHSQGDTTTAFNIVIYNTGNRPAVDIKLSANQKIIDNALRESSSEPMKKEISACFSEEGVIPLLQSGCSVLNGFGMTGDKEETILYGTKIPITIEYKDITRRKFRTKQILLYRDSTFFAGSGWRKAEKGGKNK